MFILNTQELDIQETSIENNIQEQEFEEIASQKQ